MGLLGLGGQGPAGGRICHVQGVGVGRAAFGANRLRRVLGIGDIHIGRDHFRAVAGQADGDGAAVALAGPGDEGEVAGQKIGIGGHGNGPLR